MSELSTPPDAAANADTGEALTRMAAYGKKDKRSWGPLVLVLMVLLPLAAVGVVLWLQVGLRSELAALRTDNATLQELSMNSTSQVAGLQQSQQELSTTVQQALQQELAATNAALAAQGEQLAVLEQELAATRLRVNTDTGGSPLAEAEVLLRFAQQRLVLARDTSTATELFLAADELLRGIDDPAIVPVRESLTREVLTLQAVAVVDVPGLFAQLSALSTRIEDFAVVSTAAAQDLAVTPVAAETPATDSWWGGVKRTLGEYFVVTQGAGQVVPQLDASAQFELRAVVQLHIEQAKLALLRAAPQLYQAALDDALAKSRRWLRSDDASLDEFLAALETLRDTPILADIPTADQTLAALRRLAGAAPALLPAQPADPEPLPQAVEPVEATPGTPQ